MQVNQRRDESAFDQVLSRVRSALTLAWKDLAWQMIGAGVCVYAGIRIMARIETVFDSEYGIVPMNIVFACIFFIGLSMVLMSWRLPAGPLTWLGKRESAPPPAQHPEDLSPALKFLSSFVTSYQECRERQAQDAHLSKSALAPVMNEERGYRVH